MIQNTVYIIGAGASEEADLPASDKLKKRISGLLDIRLNDSFGRTVSGDDAIVKALHLYVRQSGKGDIKPYLDAAIHIRDAMPQARSIDNFIDQHRDNGKIALCGKLAIVRSILKAEKRSHLYFERTREDSNIDFDFLDKKKTWYIPFFQLITENCEKNDLKERFQSITLIIFNYDRCVEHFIYCALQNYYKLSASEAAELVKNMKKFHPYGDVGALPWINRDKGVEFGKEPRPEKLLELAHKIKTFAEGTDPHSSNISAIRSSMAMANKTVFLGFAFLDLNMQLITPGQSQKGLGGKLLLDTGQSEIPGDFKCFATTHEVSDSNKDAITRQIYELYSFRQGINLKMANLTCGEFFEEFWKSLAF